MLHKTGLLSLAVLASLAMGCGETTPGGDLVGTTGGSTTGGAGTAPPAAAARYPVPITSEVPARAAQLRVSGDDIEGETILSVTVEAARSVTVEVPEDVRTLLLEYLDPEGHVVASYSESAVNQHDLDFRGGITNPPLIGGPGATEAKAGTRSRTGVTGTDVKFSFAFFGCNRAKTAGQDPRYPNQISAAEKASTANVAQLRQHFEDIDSLDPKPKYIFLCGDAITKGKSEGFDDASMQKMTAEVTTELTSWSQIRQYGGVIIDQQGKSTTVAPAADGSLFSSKKVIVVVMPGNHEMCFKNNNDPHPPPASAGYDYEYPNKLAGAAFRTQMAQFIWGVNGPTTNTTYDPGNPLNLFDEPVQRDESRLSYTFRDGENFFVVLNTDTYVGDSTWNGQGGDFRIRRIPLRWLRGQLAAAQTDPVIRHIFVFGHRPIQTINGEAGIDDRQATVFYKLLNNPLAKSPDELDNPVPGTPRTKVRGYLCAHAHLVSTRQPPGKKPVQQIVAGSSGSEPDPAPADEGLTGATPGKPFPWFGFAVVAVRGLSPTVDEVDVAWFGRNSHPSKNTPTGVWWEQEPLKLRGPNITGPGTAPAKTPKAMRMLYVDGAAPAKVVHEEESD